MNSLSIFILLFAFFSCSISGSKNDFDEFNDRFKVVSFPMVTNDSLVFEKWTTENLIDINYIKQYELIKKHINKNYPLKNLQDYKCSYFGRFVSQNYIVLMYKTYTTEAGRGNPEIILITFTKEGKKIDEITALWNDVEDPLYSKRVTLNIPNDYTIEIKSLVKINGYLEGKIVPKKITEKILNYTIQKNGKIKEDKETSKDVFIDDNPKILDDFPQE